VGWRKQGRKERKVNTCESQVRCAAHGTRMDTKAQAANQARSDTDKADRIQQCATWPLGPPTQHAGKAQQEP